jgi:hypothetical protein
MIAPLGLQRRRSANLIAMSAAYVAGTWRHPEELPGCGQYAAEAYHLFVAGTWREIMIKDRVLRMYLGFLEGSGGGFGSFAGKKGAEFGCVRRDVFCTRDVQDRDGVVALAAKAQEGMSYAKMVKIDVVAEEDDKNRVVLAAHGEKNHADTLEKQADKDPASAVQDDTGRANDHPTHRGHRTQRITAEKEAVVRDGVHARMVRDGTSCTHGVSTEESIQQHEDTDAKRDALGRGKRKRQKNEDLCAAGTVV